MNEDSSFELLALARTGDGDALNRLLARHLPRLRRWAAGRLPGYARGRDDTDDLVQDTVVRALRNLESFEPRREGALQAYLRQAVLNQIRDAIRRAKRRPALDVLDEEMMTGQDASPFEHAVGAETLSRVPTRLSPRCGRRTGRQSSAVSNSATTTRSWPPRWTSPPATRRVWLCTVRSCVSRRKCGVNANQVLAEVAAAVADGFPVNWAKTESTPMSPEDRGVLAELRILEELHRLHRRASSSPAERAFTPVPIDESASPVTSKSETITVDLPRTWGRFEIRELLGAGAQGAVYRAWDPQLECEVALKVLQPRHSPTPIATERGCCARAAPTRQGPPPERRRPSSAARVEGQRRPVDGAAEWAHAQGRTGVARSAGGAGGRGGRASISLMPWLPCIAPG